VELALGIPALLLAVRPGRPGMGHDGKGSTRER